MPGRARFDLLAWLCGKAFDLAERSIGQYRERLAEGLGGRVIDLGCGAGHLLPHLARQPGMVDILGVEPSATLLGMARSRADRQKIKARLVCGSAERLPVASSSVDAVVVSYVLCSVADLEATLAEVRRVLRPGGRLRFLEHVKAPQGSTLATWQDRVQRPYGLLSRGCRANQPTEQLLQSAGFEVTIFARLSVSAFVLPLVRAQILGEAVPVRTED